MSNKEVIVIKDGVIVFQDQFDSLMVADGSGGGTEPPGPAFMDTDFETFFGFPMSQGNGESKLSYPNDGATVTFTVYKNDLVVYSENAVDDAGGFTVETVGAIRAKYPNNADVQDNLDSTGLTNSQHVFWPAKIQVANYVPVTSHRFGEDYVLEHKDQYGRVTNITYRAPYKPQNGFAFLRSVGGSNQYIKTNWS